uniref:Uncharacterized protein n=1 Tax=uncultured bacterium contig00003(2014) TaxID=1465624 RepID=A0A060CVX7_9BACT|nr:hypothetical protein [uncultured bacterium contig00003(2014)]
MNAKAGSGIILILLTVVISACIKDTEPGDSCRNGGATVVNFNVGFTRATDEADEDQADNEINSLRMLIYNSGSGDLAYNIDLPTVPTASDPASLEIMVGTYDFVFIANEDSDDVLKGHLISSGNADIDDITKLRALSFSRSAFDADTAIPMVTFIEQVAVANNTVKTPDMNTPLSGVWSVNMERVAVRLRMTFTMTESLFDRWEAASKAITIDGIAGGAYVLPAIDNSAARIGAPESFAATDTADAAPGLISGPDGSGNVTVVYDRLILPELFFSSDNTGNTADNAMVVSMDFGDNVKSGTANAPTGYGWGYGLPRNTFLDMNITIDEYRMTIEAEVVPWNDTDIDRTFDGQYRLTVDRDEYFFNSYGNPQPIGVTTDYPGGWTTQSSTLTWVTMPTQKYNSIAAAAYTGTTPRTGSFTIVAGNLRKTIRVTQFPPAAEITDAIIPNSYVGAFWRNDQSGERLIRIPSGAGNGDWTAIVAEGEDWIHLDTEMTSDPNVGWLDGANETDVIDGNDPGFDDTYFVNGNLKDVHGEVNTDNPEIYFRIGLNSQYAPTDNAPARYGVVLLAYGGNTNMQRIWIRQGEGADYVFKNSDPVNSAGITSRTVTVRFSPYNLTAETFGVSVSINGATDDPAFQPAVFSDYPSQAGAYWQWASSTQPRYAYSPVGNAATNYNGNSGVPTTDWATNGAINESCPTGYRRPYDGPISGYVNIAGISQSEPLQSLWLNPQLYLDYNQDNASIGYYADGFFDRRQLETPDGTPSTSGSTVAANTLDVAYRGCVFHNPTSHASLFIPFSGSRDSNNSLALPGQALNMWTCGTTTTSNYGTEIFSNNNMIGMNNAIKYLASAIRCVVNE